MAKDREGSVNIYGAMQAKTAQGIVAYTDGIAHEKEDGTVINLDEMLKNGVGGGSAIVDVEELVYPGWIGTTVPNSGEVGDIYFNTNLSNKEYYEIVNKLTFIDSSVIGGSGFSFYPVMAYLFNNIPYVTAFKKFSDTDIDFATVNFSTMASTQDYFIGDEGWQQFPNPSLGSLFNQPLQFLSELSGLPIGSENDKLSSLISTTPFVKGEEPKDDVFYRLTLSTQGGWSGTAVPNEGTVENIYFNTNLTKEQIIELCKPLNYSLADGYNYFLLSNSDVTELFVIATDSDTNISEIAIANLSNEITVFYDSSDIMGVGITGWNTEISYPFVVNFDTISEMSGFQIGEQNELISSLFSTTPFEYIEGEKKYDIYSYKDNQYKRVLQEGDVNTESNNSNQKEEINLGSLDLTDVQGSQYMTKNFDVDSDTYNKLLSGNCIPKLTLNFSNYSGISGATSILYLTFNDVSTGAFSYNGNTGFSVYYSTFPVGGVNQSYDNSSSSVNKAEKYNLIPSTDGTNYWVTFSRFEFIQNTTDTVSQDIGSPVTSKGVYNALQSYAKTTEVNQMIADYITTNFENGDEGSY